MVVIGPSAAGAELEARRGLDALRSSPPSLFDAVDPEALEPSDREDVSAEPGTR